MNGIGGRMNGCAMVVRRLRRRRNAGSGLKAQGCGLRGRLRAYGLRVDGICLLKPEAFSPKPFVALIVLPASSCANLPV
jgi:hypothetical protein